MESILLGLHVIIAMALIVIVLIQRSDQDGFGMGSGSGANLMTGRQSANLLTRITAVLAAVFMLNSLVLTILAAGQNDVSIVDRIEASESRSVGEIAEEETLNNVEPDAFPEAPEAGESLPEVPIKE